MNILIFFLIVTTVYLMPLYIIGQQQSSFGQKIVWALIVIFLPVIGFALFMITRYKNNN
ncbi:PLDc N-terminal domain-containing protein [Pseudoalteromonas sp. T1lg24]|uniref:PLDc N-terminal domain-containing protein n=1 Tax=Pseudoalteromonas sp. T1lg24 TaxID=2077099 RepID=UPI000CF6D18E